MLNIIRCPKCGKLYEAFSEELANEPSLMNPYAGYCPDCFLWARKHELEKE